jgi:hypothetical protein
VTRTQNSASLHCSSAVWNWLLPSERPLSASRQRPCKWSDLTSSPATSLIPIKGPSHAKATPTHQALPSRPSPWTLPNRSRFPSVVWLRQTHMFSPRQTIHSHKTYTSTRWLTHGHLTTLPTALIPRLFMASWTGLATSITAATITCPLKKPSPQSSRPALAPRGPRPRQLQPTLPVLHLGLHHCLPLRCRRPIIRLWETLPG